MTREASQRPGPSDALGIVVTALAGVLLAVVLFQIFRLGNEAGLSRDSLTRERVAVTETSHIQASLDALDDYRQALMLRSPDVARKCDLAQARLDALHRDFVSGSAAMFRLQAQWNAIDRAWENARVLNGGPDTLAKMRPTMNAIAELLSSLEDRSGLSYDPSTVAQNLADVYMQGTVSGLSGTRRLESISALALQQHGMSLSERLDAAGNLMNLRESFDLSRDQLPAAVTNLDELAPGQRAQWEAIPALAQRMDAAGEGFLDLVVHNVMLQPRPISAAVLHQSAARAIDATKAVYALSGRCSTPA